MQRAIVEALAELKVEEFEAAVQLVVNRHPGLLPPGTEEFDLELEPLDSLTLRQLSAFCRACHRGRAAGAPPSWPGLVFGAGSRSMKDSSRLTMSLQRTGLRRVDVTRAHLSDGKLTGPDLLQPLHWSGA